MATPKPAKKRKKPSPKKSVPSLKKKKVTKKVSAKKKDVRKMKLLKKLVKRPKSRKPSAPRDGKEGPRNVLLEMREKLLADISENIIPETLIASTEIGDLIDQAGDERDRELSLLLSGRDKEKLAAIDEALEKLEEGTYGICEECGDKIGPGRLKVMPLARLCVNCQSKMEKEISLLKRADEEGTYRGLAFSSSSDEEES
jgi:DnaK suppressor protein